MTTPHSAAEQRLCAAIAEYNAAPARALETRDEAIRAAADMGLRQVDIVQITGYSRETIRKALSPEVRAAVRQAREQRAASQPASVAAVQSGDHVGWGHCQTI
jgi:hypothetical protein